MGLDFLKKDIRIGKVSDETNLKLNKIVNLLIWYIIIINPLVILFLNGKEVHIGETILDCFTDLKAIFLWSVSFVLFIIFLIKRELKFDLIEKLILSFGIIVIVSTINSINPIISFWGNQGRREGLISFLSYCVIFIMAKRYLVINKKRIDTFLFIGALMSVYGLLQFWGLDPISKFYEVRGSAIGTIGNQNFFSSYLIILLSISISGFILKNIKKYFIYSNLFFAALICTLTRGGWLSLGFFCLIGLLFILKNKNALIRSIFIIISFILVFCTINFTSNGRVFERASTIKENITDINEKSGSGRIYIWKLTSKVIKKYPILGTGPESLSTSIVKDFEEDIRYWRKNYSATFIDKAHNELLNIAATTGIISLLIYLAIIFIILMSLFKDRINDNKKILIIMIIAYFTQGLFNISVIGVAPIFWIILSIASRSVYNKDIFSGKEIKLYN